MGWNLKSFLILQILMTRPHFQFLFFKEHCSRQENLKYNKLKKLWVCNDPCANKNSFFENILVIFSRFIFQRTSLSYQPWNFSSWMEFLLKNLRIYDTMLAPNKQIIKKIKQWFRVRSYIIFVLPPFFWAFSLFSSKARNSSRIRFAFSAKSASFPKSLTISSKPASWMSLL